MGKLCRTCTGYVRNLRRYNSFEYRRCGLWKRLTKPFDAITGLSGDGFTLEAAYGAQALVLVSERANVLFQPVSGAGSFSFQILTIPGLAYEIQYTDSLSQPDWKSLTQASGDPAPQTVTDASPPPDQRYYRTVVVPSP